MTRQGLSGIVLALAACALMAPARAENPIARGSAISPVDCADPRDMVVQYEAAPRDRTYLRVQHMGDPGTEELAGEISTVVTWAVDAVTGFAAPPEGQRGYRNEPGMNAFQLWCAGAGFFVDTARFAHRSPLVGEGPNVSVARDFSRAWPAFRDGASLRVAGTVRVPWIRNQRAPVIGEGTAQVGFWYYAQDSTTGTVIAHLLGVFDNRAPGVNGSGVETWGSDGIVAFISSPIAPVDALGSPTRFISFSPGSATMQHQRGWTEGRGFTVTITPEGFRAALELLRAGPLPKISGDPADYRILSFGWGGEVIPGTGDDDNVSLGASVTDLSLRESPLRRSMRNRSLGKQAAHPLLAKAREAVPLVEAARRRVVEVRRGVDAGHTDAAQLLLE